MNVTASIVHNGHELTDLPVANLGEAFGHAWLVEVGGSYSPFFLIVEGDNWSDALDALSDSKWGEQIHVAESDLDDYPEESRHYDGSGRVIDTDWIMIHGPVEPDYHTSIMLKGESRTFQVINATESTSNLTWLFRVEDGPEGLVRADSLVEAVEIWDDMFPHDGETYINIEGPLL